MACENERKSKKFSRIFPESDGDEIVISGMAGKFPNSRNVEEYKYNLYNKIDMIDDDERRWRHFNPEIPKRSGKIYDLNKFDATFFGIHFKQAHTMDPQTRIIIETAYEAVIDAGINPKSLRGSRTGVYVGACISESEKTWFYEKVPSGGFGITGCSRAMLANRISYFLGLEGPSFLIDTACSSSMYALDNAFTALRNGEIDAAIIGGANLVLHPFVTLQFARLGVLAPDGFCRPFDKDAKGYTRAEAINCLFLQRKRDAKRIYASVIYSKTNCDGYKPEGITYPSGKLQEKLLKEFYSEVDVTPNHLGYVEAHSTGTVVGDPEECRAIDNVLCYQRTEPLLVGSVKSNVGHSEPASGICSLIKVCLAFETGKIPPNINFSEIKHEIPALAEGRLKVVHEVEALEKPYIGVSSFGFGGANAHALLKGFEKAKKYYGLPQDDIPRLVTWAGRTHESVTAIFEAMEKNPLDAEYVALLHNIQKEEVPGMVFRGFGVFAKNDIQPAQCLKQEIQHFTGIKRPTVWVFSGMGSQWTEMGASLMIIPEFRSSIEKCHSILETVGLDLVHILTSSNESIYDNILNSFVGIAAVQIGIVDTLRSLNLQPDFIIGHSVGELGCGYADGAFTREQMILAAYYRGKVSLETEKIKGSMAAVGLGFKDIVNILPEPIEVACHNGNESCTISGPAQEVKKYIDYLKSKEIFAKEVPCSNIPYHSRYIAHMGPHLLKYLQELIPEPKLRSEKWLSTSVPKNAWDQKAASYCSAEYHTNNLLNSVLFQETFALLPNNALTIEIAPHGLLQAILKQSMHNGVHIPLTQRQNKNNALFFLTALGRLFNTGITFPVENLYPKIQFPVSRNTAGISSLVRWDHSEDWFVTKYENMKTKASGERLFKINLSSDNEEYIRGHVIDGKVLIPATAYLEYVWQTFSLMYHGPSFMDVPVEFENVRFLRATNLSINTNVELNVMIHYGTGNFEITESGSLVVTGRIQEIQQPVVPEIPENVENLDFPILNKRDFYKELKLRGYHYQGAFKAVESARSDGSNGQIKWDYNWVAFIDAMLQINIVGINSRSLFVPTKLMKLRIYGKHHFDMLTKMDPDNRLFNVYIDKNSNRIVSGGIEVIGMDANPIQRRKPPGVPVLEYYKFIPYYMQQKLKKSDAIRVCVQLALENQPVTKLKIIEVLNNNTNYTITLFREAIEDLPLITGDYVLLTNEKLDEIQGITIDSGNLSSQSNCYFVIIDNNSKKYDLCNEIDSIEKSIVKGGWLILKKYNKEHVNKLLSSQFQLVSIIPIEEGDENMLLLRKDTTKSDVDVPIIHVDETDEDMNWITNIQEAIENKKPSIILSEKQHLSGILGFMNCLLKEPKGNLFKLFLINDDSAPAFNVNDEFYAKQLAQGLAINIYYNGHWGSYRHLQLPIDENVSPRSGHVFGNQIHRGDLSSLQWFDGPLDSENSNIKIAYSSLNFRDIMLATGRLQVGVHYGMNNQDYGCVLGLEYSGIDMRTGKRIMSMIASGGVSSYIEKPSKLFWEVPNNWTLEEAATVPVVYITVYYAFFMCSDIRKGKSILIHAGTGGVGLAAIRVALAYNLEVFTTCSTQKKKDFLLKTFPQLKASHIGNSRDTSFEYMINHETHGKGVDFVLNSLSEEKLLASIRCLGVSGQFLEIGKFDMANDSMLPMSYFLKENKFIPVFADRLLIASENEVNALKTILQTDINNGIIKPLPATVFAASDIEQAFRHLIGGKHIGKVLIKIREDPESNYTMPIKVCKQVYFKKNRSYIICGGLGGFGLELCDWMIKRGANKLLLSSSRGITKSYQEYRITLWKSYGCDVRITTSDITTKEGCQNIILEAKKLAPIGGIFNLAVTLRDGIFENQTRDKFRECLGPKAVATKYLDEISKNLNPQLDHFVVFSSVSCGRGNAGQTNYGMANSVMERIIEHRHQNGLSGKAIQWGAVGEVGLVADLAEDKIDMEIGGTLQQRISSCLHELDALLLESYPVVSSMVVAEKRVGRSGNESIIETVMNIMGIRDLKSISLGTTLSEMGMDSLMAVEIKQTLERDFELVLSPQDLRSLTFQKIQEYDEAQKRNNKDMGKSIFNSDAKINGMELLLRNMGDEKCCNEDLVVLKTKTTSEPIGNPIFVIPGLEGTAGQAWYTVGSDISHETYLIQLHKFSDKDNVKDIAQLAFEVLKSKLNPKFPFYVVGYSYGSLIALALTKILETNGYVGHITLIDGAPHFLKKLSLAQLGEEFSDNDLYNLIICSIVNQIFPNEKPEKTFEVFRNLKTIDCKMTTFMDYVDRQSIYSKEYAKTTINAMFRRLQMTTKYNLDEKHDLKSPILLVRPTEVSLQDIKEDYHLSEITAGPVTLKVIDGNHTTMLDNPSLPDIINKFYPSFEADKNLKDNV